ncbi:unnamed protein product, partial [Dibothriocephalus latus]
MVHFVYHVRVARSVEVTHSRRGSYLIDHTYDKLPPVVLTSIERLVSPEPPRSILSSARGDTVAGRNLWRQFSYNPQIAHSNGPMDEFHFSPPLFRRFSPPIKHVASAEPVEDMPLDLTDSGCGH